MKTLVVKIAALMLVFALSLALLTACGGLIDPEGECLVVIGTEGSYTEYKIGLSDIEGGEGLFTLLEYLRERDGLTFEVSNGAYGKMLYAVGELAPDSTKNEYISLFTSVAEDFDVSEWAQEMTYKGTALKTSGLGASMMQIKAGGVFLITIGTY